MKKIVLIIISTVLFSQLVGCGPTVHKEGVGTVVGGLAGGLIGSRFGSGGGQVAAIAGGAIIGAVIGNKIGQYMDRTDRLAWNAAMERNPDLRPARWHNPNTNASYVVVPTRTYVTNDQPCREYRTTANIAGKKQQIYGTACREADGNWRVQNG